MALAPDLRQPPGLPTDQDHPIARAERAFHILHQVAQVAAVAGGRMKTQGQIAGDFLLAVPQDQMGTVGQVLLPLVPGQVGDGVIGGDEALRLRGPAQVHRLLLQFRPGVPALRRFVHHQQSVGGEIVQRRGGVGVEVGQVEFQAGEGGARGQPLPVGGQFPGDFGGMGGVQPIVQAESLRYDPRAVAGEGLPRRDNGHLLQPFGGALGGGVKPADGVHVGAEEFYPYGPLLARGEDVQDAAAVAELAGHLHDADGLVAQAGPAAQRGLQVQGLPDAQGVGAGAELPDGEGGLHQRAGRGDDDQAGERVQQRAEDRQARGDGLARPGGTLVEKSGRFRQAQDAGRLRMPVRQGLVEGARPRHAARDQKDGALQVAGQRGHHGRPGGAEQAQRRGKIAAAHFLSQIPVCRQVTQPGKETGDGHNGRWATDDGLSRIIPLYYRSRVGQH
jgi:hypothetical protein